MASIKDSQRNAKDAKLKVKSHAAFWKDDANCISRRKKGEEKGPREGRVDGMGVDDEALYSIGWPIMAIERVTKVSI